MIVNKLSVNNCGKLIQRVRTHRTPAEDVCCATVFKHFYPIFDSTKPLWSCSHFSTGITEALFGTLIVVVLFDLYIRHIVSVLIQTGRISFLHPHRCLDDRPPGNWSLEFFSHYAHSGSKILPFSMGFTVSINWWEPKCNEWKWEGSDIHKVQVGRATTVLAPN